MNLWKSGRTTKHRWQESLWCHVSQHLLRSCAYTCLGAESVSTGLQASEDDCSQVSLKCFEKNSTACTTTELKLNKNHRPDNS